MMKAARFAMTGAMTGALLAAAWALPALTLPAWAQTGGNYDVKTLNFDLWCQEEQHLPADRCDKRLPEDEKVFEDYRAKIERYEIPYLQRQRNELLLDRNVLRKDPVDNPVPKDFQAQSQAPNEQPSTPAP